MRVASDTRFAESDGRTATGSPAARALAPEARRRRGRHGAAVAASVLLTAAAAWPAPAMAQDVTDFGKSFYEALQARLAQELGGTVAGGDLAAIETSDFNWFWQLSGGFNDTTWQQIDAIVRPGSKGGVTLADGQSFTTVYANTVLPAISFKFSNAAQQIINKAQTKAAAAALDLVNEFEDIYGPITDEALNAAAEVMGQVGTFNKTDYVTSFEIAYQWTCRKAMKKPPMPLAGIDRNNLANELKCMPSSGTSLLGDFTNWLDASDQSLALLDAQNQGGALLSAVETNVRKPTDDNGGIKTNAGKTRPAYAISRAVSVIESGLEGSSTVGLSMTLEKKSEQTISANVETSGAVTVPIDFITIGASGGAKFDLFSYKGIENSMTVNMTWKGVTLFDVTAATYAGGSGWYDETIIAQALANEGKDVTGYQFIGPAPVSFGKGGNFARVAKLVISQYPAIDVSVGVSDIKAFQQSFQQSSKWDIGFLGFRLGGVEESFYEGTYDYDQKTGKVTIHYAPGDITQMGSESAKVANILGGVIDYPGS